MKYRISHTLDPEERLEDAAMAKAMFDALGVDIVSEGPADFGRDRHFSGPRGNVAYWEDPAFLHHAGRSVDLCDVLRAEKVVHTFHRQGRDAFVKSADLKLFATRVPQGASLHEAIGDMIWSVIDRPPCIMVQPFCDMRYEMRFVSVGRRIVTSSPVAPHLTPISRIPGDHLYRTPGAPSPEPAPGVEGMLHGLASRVAAGCREEDVVIDCAMIDGAPGVIEFNPFSVGNFGLYACDPAAIANAVRDRIGAVPYAFRECPPETGCRDVDEELFP